MLLAMEVQIIEQVQLPLGFLGRNEKNFHQQQLRDHWQVGEILTVHVFFQK